MLPVRLRTIYPLTDGLASWLHWPISQYSTSGKPLRPGGKTGITLPPIPIFVLSIPASTFKS